MPTLQPTASRPAPLRPDPSLGVVEFNDGPAGAALPATFTDDATGAVYALDDRGRIPCRCPECGSIPAASSPPPISATVVRNAPAVPSMSTVASAYLQHSRDREIVELLRA